MTFYPGQRVEAKWDGDEYFPATVKKQNPSGSLSLEYDDGGFWENAPTKVIKPRKTVAGAKRKSVTIAADTKPNASEEVKPKKPRGRPPKAKAEPAPAPAAKPRGRPPKAKVEPKAEPKEEDAPKKPRGRPPKVPKKESEKPKPAKKSVDPKYKTPKGQATKPSTAGSETSPPKSKPTGGMLNKKVMATWDSDIAYPARVVGVTWSDSLDLLTHVDLKFDDGAFWNKAPVTTIKGLA